MAESIIDFANRVGELIKANRGQKGDKGDPGPYGGTQVTDPQVAELLRIGAETSVVFGHKVTKGERIGVGSPPSQHHQALIKASNGTNTTGLRVEQENAANPREAVKIVNLSPSYALKIDHTPATPYDGVNIFTGGGGGYTALGVGGDNTSLSTVKITNNAAQVGGAVLAAYGTVRERTAVIIQAENYGSGASFSAHQWEGANAPAFRAIYDSGYTHDARALWVDANHASGSIVYINNPSAQASGEMMFLGQANTASTAGVLRIINAGTGDTINAPGFAVSAAGNVRATTLHNPGSFNNSRLQLANVGAIIDRNVDDASSALRINQQGAGSTGDILQLQSSGEVRARFARHGHLALRVNTEPTDASLNSGEMAFWVDATDGQAKLMVKAKQANGAVVIGKVDLA